MRKDYVRMQWMMLQQEQPEDFVIATGAQYSAVRQFVRSWRRRNHKTALLGWAKALMRKGSWYPLPDTMLRA